jgi:Cof subfamily protein (haloacid dehalogenase superfamily)
MIRLVATDLDGTVVRPDGSMSQRTARALRGVEEAGLRLVLVTGRPPRWMSSVVDATGHRGLAICANGAYVYDLHDEHIVEEFLLDPRDAQEAVRLVREVLPAAGFAVERQGGFSHDPQYRPRWDADPARVAPVEELVQAPMGKLLVRDETSTGDAMLQAVRGRLAGVVDVTHSNVNDCLLELSARGVSKATTLAHLARQWGIDRHEVVAFGDMPNDVAMLQWAGIGYAVAGAHPEVLDAVDHVTESVLEDGVAKVIEALLARS